MNEDYYVVLHGAKKNVGDFLIRERAKKLLQNIRKDRQLIEFPSWQPLDEHIETINSAKALIIMGGPAISSNIYPNVFPLVSNIDDLKVPIYLMGVGSYISPLSYYKRYRLTSATKRFLQKCSYIGVRDVLTQFILKNNDITNVSMTGCPAWYDLDKLTLKFKYPKEIKTILLSTPQKKIYFPQFVELADKVKKSFPDANILVTFNRGYKEDKYTNERESEYMKYYYNLLKSMNFNVVDVSKNLALFMEHLAFDMHIGYRLHTHINFISNRKISYLISEDSRGYGHCQTLSLPIFRAEQDSLIEKIFPFLTEGLIKRAVNHYLPLVELNSKIVDEIINYIQYNISVNYASFYGLENKLLQNYNTMQKFIKELP